MSYSNNKDLAKVIREKIKLGWRFCKGRKHGKLTSPCGRSIPVPITPSDYRALNNFKRDLRRLCDA